MASNIEEEHVISVKKENNKNSSNFYRIHTIWNNEQIRFNVASQTGAWTGTVPKEALNNVNMSNESQECKLALTTPNGLPGYVYAVENGFFQWKKIVEEDAGVTIKMGAVPLEPAQFNDVIQNMMTAVLTKNQKLELEKVKLAQENELVKNNESKVIQQLEASIRKAADEVERQESSFLLLLNAKKNKICELQEDLIKARADNPSPEKRKRRGRNLKPAKEDPYGGDTDEDMPLVPSYSQPGPSYKCDRVSYVEADTSPVKPTANGRIIPNSIPVIGEIASTARRSQEPVNNAMAEEPSTSTGRGREVRVLTQELSASTSGNSSQNLNPEDAVSSSNVDQINIPLVSCRQVANDCEVTEGPSSTLPSDPNDYVSFLFNHN